MENPEVLQQYIHVLEKQIAGYKREAIDSKALRARIAELEARPSITPPILTPNQKQLIQKTTEILNTDSRNLATTVAKLVQSLATLNQMLLNIPQDDVPNEPTNPQTVVNKQATTTISVTRRHDSQTTTDTTLPKAARTLLIALGALPEGKTTRRALAALARMSPNKSTIRNALSDLRVRGLIETPGLAVNLTAAGRNIIGPVTQPHTTTATITMWREKVREASPRAIFDVLIASYPKPISREDLGSRAGIDWSKSTFRNALSRLRVQGLIEENEHGVCASHVLFPSGPIASRLSLPN
jgi:hypothetical protein